MTGWSALSALLLGLAVVVMALPRAGHERWSALARSGPAGAASPAGTATGRQPLRGEAGPAAGGGASPRLACSLAGAAVVWLGGGGPAALVLGGAVVVLGPNALGRLEPAGARRERERLLDDLPTALDLLSACLAGGASLGGAAAAVAAAVPGPCGTRLGRVAAALAVGTPAAEAWAVLSGGDPDDPLAPAARALGRASSSGVAAAGAVSRLAVDARQAARSRGEQAARRAGVLAVAPLGLCFLPAFVLLGVVPLVAGLVGPLLATL